jgi:hypothetical protein
MKRYLVVVLALVVILNIGCRPKHPNTVTIDPAFNPNEAGTILVTPSFSAITEGEDPDRESEKVVNRVLWELLSARTDHDFLSPVQFTYILQRARIADKLDAFKAEWIKQHAVDMEFLRKVGEQINADLLLIPSVHLWYKDEVDFRVEEASSTTQVGMTLSLIDMSTGDVVWEAVDENYKEAVRSEGQRVRYVSEAGVIRRVEGVTSSGRDMYAAPPFDDVVLLVLRVLVDALPQRGVYGQ